VKLWPFLIDAGLSMLDSAIHSVITEAKNMSASLLGVINQNSIRACSRLLIASVACILTGVMSAAIAAAPASNGPGKASPWSYAGKQGIGAAYEAYVDHRYQTNTSTGEVSKVWFSLANGILTETMYGKIHEAQIREMKFIIAGADFVADEAHDADSHVAYLYKDNSGRPLSPAYRLTNTDRKGRFIITKDVFTDPDRQSLMMRVTIAATGAAVTPYLVLDSSVANTSGNDQGKASTMALTAFEGNTALALRASLEFVKASVGFTDVDDGFAEVAAGRGLVNARRSTEGTVGNIRHLAQLPAVTKSLTFDLALGFGPDESSANQAAAVTLQTGYQAVLAKYNGVGKQVGWQDYLASLTELKSLVGMSGDRGKLLYASALMLKVQEDRTYSGALIASLSNPWGDTTYSELSSTGYKAVWPRDFYQVSMALLALGDKQTPVAAYRYLPTVQMGPDTPGNKGVGGWFLQKSHVDGTLEWVGVQLDQTAMPILLGARLFRMGLISKAELVASYNNSLKRAADFLVNGGAVNIESNQRTIVSPYSQQERWEEQEGYSPSTIAAVIAGLQAASGIATEAGDPAAATLYAATARSFSDQLEPRLHTTRGMVQGRPNSYYLRISHSQDANAPGKQSVANGQASLESDLMMDQGFIELVRYGVRAADDPRIVQSLSVIDDQRIADNLRVRYDLKYGAVTVPGFRRYGNDGYGERLSGGNYADNGQMNADQRGRIWPIFTGERGHYELALAQTRVGGVTRADMTTLRSTYVRGMELMANEGLMIPEQIFDGVGERGPHNYQIGEGTDSATPLAWSHAEYIKLLRSLRDKRVWDLHAETAAIFTRK
jgi:glucoamylase